MKTTSKIIIAMAVWLCVVMLIYYMPGLPSYNDTLMSGIAAGAFLASIAVAVLFDDD